MKFPGSNWWSFDFHNHTPASSDYNATERTQITPRDWLLAYMRSGVDCVAITDHNSADRIQALQQELAVMRAEQPLAPDYREIYLFPGVELTTAEGLHVIGVYGCDDSAGKVHGLITLARYNNDPNNAHGICSESATAICQHIHDTGGVVILAHAEEINGIFHGTADPTSGLFTPTRPGRVIDQILENADGIEIHNLGSAAYQHFATLLKDYALVNGSDAHRTADAGVRRVWVKMAHPSIEGLKLALLDPTSSLLRAANKPSAPDHRITSLRVTNLQLRRQPLNIDFSPWFNAIIGGRGSGKSTILETLRLALARESDIDELGASSDVFRAFSRFKQVGGTRSNSGMIRPESALTVEVEKHDYALDVKECYSFEWKPGSFQVRRRDEAGAWAETGLSAEQASEIFPVKVFSQKQIFELAERPSALLTYIDRVPEVNYSRWADENAFLCRALKSAREEERALLQAIEKKAHLETEKKEVDRKAAAYQQSSVATQVKTFSENESAQKVVNDFVANICEPILRLEKNLGVASPFGTIQLATISLQSPHLTGVHHAANEAVRSLGDKYAILLQTVEAMKQEVTAFQTNAAVLALKVETDQAITSYRSEVARLQAEGVGTAQEAETALKRQQELIAALADITSQEERLKVVKRSMLRAYSALKLHRLKLTRLRQEFVHSTLATNQNLRITIEGQADVEQSAEQFRSILRLQENTFIDEVLSTHELTGQPSGLLGSLVAEGIHDPTHKRVTSLKLGILERSKEILGQTIHGKLVSALSRLGPDDDDALLEWFPEDKVQVGFRRNSTGPFQSLERASAGQKTSSILSFLLSHGTEPLLLDQPEDDLDNALVSELVVQQIRGNKSRRQMLVVTHNPNIVVNGDAELVLPMGFANGQIQQNHAGGLQERAVRRCICDIMEGGRDAFRQRYKRILEDLDA